MIWRMIGSIRVSLVLLWVIIAVSFAGALLPSEKQPLVYSSVWFFSILGCFALNLLVCSIDRLAFNRKRIASTVTHAAILVVLIGSLMSAVFGFRGSMELSEGRTAGSFIAGGTTRQLPFTLTLEDFSLEWYESARDGYPLRVRIEDAGYEGKFLARPGVDHPLGGTGYTFTVVRYVPHFVLDEEHNAGSRSSQPVNPALLIRIAGPANAEDRWVFSLHPDIQMGDPNIRFRFDLDPQIKAYRSRVLVTDQARRTAFTRDIKVNAPLEYRGYSIYQSRYDSEQLAWTGLDVVYDPGVKIVFLGFILLNAGIIAIFYPKFKASFASAHNENHG